MKKKSTSGKKSKTSEKGKSAAGKISNQNTVGRAAVDDIIVTSRLSIFVEQEVSEECFCREADEEERRVCEGGPFGTLTRKKEREVAEIISFWRKNEFNGISVVHVGMGFPDHAVSDKMANAKNMIRAADSGLKKKRKKERKSR